MNDVPGPTSTPPAPAEGSGDELRPGAGAPVVAGPPRSVSGPARSGRLNAGLGVAGALYWLAIAFAVVLVVVVVIALIVHFVRR